MDTEEWRDVVGYEGLYEVSSLGRVKSCEKLVGTRWGPSVKARRSEKILSPTPNEDGHLRVSLAGPNGTKLVFVHRLVALAFIPNPENRPLVLHWDDNGSNNVVDNLRWGTVSDNWNDMVRNGNHHNARKTHCPRGHPYTPENTRIDKLGRRGCKTCSRERHYRMVAELRDIPDHRLHGTISGRVYKCRCERCMQVVMA